MENRGNPERLVVVGGGMAATRLIEEVTAAAPGRYRITVVGEEPQPAYNRVLLSCVLAGEADIADIALKPEQWWRSAGVEFLRGRRAVEIDRVARKVRLDDGARLSYCKLVLATGSRALRLDIDGARLPGVHTFRDLADVEALSRLGANGKNVLVIGGGLLGLEAAHGLVRRGARVTLAHVMDRLMERQLDADGGALLKTLVETTGVRVLLGADTKRIAGAGRVEQVEFADGSALEADAVVFAVGVCANAELAHDAGLAVNRGVIVNDGLVTDDPDIFALGECAEHRGVCYGLVEPAYEQARVLAARLAGHEAQYGGSVVSTNLKVSGVRVFSAGDHLGRPGADVLYCKDPRMGVYRKLVVEGDRLTGAILLGETSGARDCLDLIRSGRSVANVRDQLMFGAPRLQEAA
ncbi:FAD-dependent oxidoreductase [Methylocystis sp. IM3]|uniref:NAD(P)/FAD-dependent oxidoreductase n=1 Tax=unclassified Methylocystis TaxID=2625913 RepID=UPI0031197EE7